MTTGMADFFKHNLWANLHLLDVCAGLDDVQLSASVDGTRGSVRDTLVHLFGAEQRYVQRFTGKPAEIRIHEKNPSPGFDVLRRGAQESGEALIKIAEQFQPDRIFHETYDGREHHIPAIVLLIQAINHATDHRSQIATILTQQGISAPELDGWEYYDKVIVPEMAK
jgi:uncharacterized damage-inducible protein DinB